MYVLRMGEIDLELLVDQKEDDVPRPHSGEGRHESFVESQDSFALDGFHSTVKRRLVNSDVLLVTHHVNGGRPPSRRRIFAP